MNSATSPLCYFPSFLLRRTTHRVPKTRWNPRWKLNTTSAGVPTGSEWGRKLSQFSFSSCCSQNSHLLYKLQAARSWCPNQTDQQTSEKPPLVHSGQFIFRLKWAQMGRTFSHGGVPWLISSQTRLELGPRVCTGKGQSEENAAVVVLRVMNVI